MIVGVWVDLGGSVNGRAVGVAGCLIGVTDGCSAMPTVRRGVIVGAGSASDEGVVQALKIRAMPMIKK
jgi:hypothetical protein